MFCLYENVKQLFQSRCVTPLSKLIHSAAFRLDKFHCHMLQLSDSWLNNFLLFLSPQVTVEGFEPLLQFAYTSKLLFTKENIHAIQTSAEILGFHNLESACFDFLIPKFSEGKRASQEVRHKVCCQSWMHGSSFGSSVRSSHAESFDSHSSVPSGGDEQTDFPSQCHQSTQGQTNSGEDSFCFESCGTQMASLSLELAANGVCPMLSLPCSGSDKTDQTSHFCEKDILQIGDVCNQSELSLASCNLQCELSTPGDVNLPEITEPASRDNKEAVERLGAEASGNSGSCPLKTSGADCCSSVLDQSVGCPVQETAGDLTDPTLTDLEHEERSRVEREVAEHLAKGFWSDLCTSQAPPQSLDAVTQNNLAKASDFHWLKQLDLSSSVGDCPFFRDIGTGDDPGTHTDGLSQAEKSPCLSSSINSGDESEMDTDGETEATSKRAAEVIVIHNLSLFNQH